MLKILSVLLLMSDRTVTAVAEKILIHNISIKSVW